MDATTEPPSPAAATAEYRPTWAHGLHADATPEELAAARRIWEMRMDGYAAMPERRKLEMVFRMMAQGHEWALAALRSANPELPEADIRAIYLKRRKRRTNRNY